MVLAAQPGAILCVPGLLVRQVVRAAQVLAVAVVVVVLMVVVLAARVLLTPLAEVAEVARGVVERLLLSPPAD